MPCKLKRNDVSNIVCGVISTREGQIVTEFTRFDEDLGVDGPRRRTYYVPVRREIRHHGCNLTQTTPDTFGDDKIKVVGKLVDAVWKDLKDQKEN